MRENSLESLHGQMRERTSFCPLNEISPTLLITVLSLEDFSFFAHRGYEPRRIREALWSNLKALRHVKGGSTITQQLAKNLYFSFRKSYARKLAELFVTRAVESRFSKEQILEWYLNIIDFGQGQHGIGDAANRYFGKHPSALTFNESLTLGCLLPAPNRYNPIENPQLFTLARRAAMRTMVAAGVLRSDHTDVVDACAYDAALPEPIARTYAQIGALLWLDATGQRQMAQPNLTSPTIDRLFSRRRVPEDLLAHADHCSRLPNRYVFGGLMERLTPALVQDRAKRYPSAYPNELIQNLSTAARDGEVYGCDCSGLIKSFFFGVGRPEYDFFLDRNSQMLLQASLRKGSIDQMPDVAGLCLFMPGHVGIYRGAGSVIECTANPAFGDGVVITQLADRAWTHWFECPFVSYEG